MAGETSEGKGREAEGRLDWLGRSQYGGVPGPTMGYVGKIGLDRDCVPTRARQ